ncbi:3-oxoacyl-ACP reductase [Streptomyces sp. WMMC500]|uniref:3-oxoacyl-ACP reductase n=1 Tax=Streptomyces sp. WMMC500 TaxID=3015154 RepID=UPI00248CD3A9|nr:3-oxoacyl-ACP reductase [Streptomyces sp. WMMC500]WBB58755.1 3-oxoacyl-ACP reductase [Streptomyces sp. WMMC500]
MADRYQKFTSRGAGAFVAKRLGLPRPARLERYRPGRPVARGPVVLGGAAGGRMRKTLRELLDAAGADVAEAGSEEAVRAGALVFDATGIDSSARLRELYDFFHPRIRSLAPCGRVVVVGTPPEDAAAPGEAVAQQALDGFVRSVGKELRDGSTAHLLLVAPGAEGGVESTLRFALSARSAYVSGQALRVTGAAPVPRTADWERPLAGKTALVTGAAQGIGAAVAETLHRDGAQVVCLDVPVQGAELARTAARVAGGALELNITAPDAAARLAAYLEDHHGGVDVVVHNAGITRDKTLGRMRAEQWAGVVEVNLTAVETLTARLLGDGLVRADGRIVCTSSISGIAGNTGQTNYAASKAGLIGYVRAAAPAAAERGVTVNAVAPGFVETRMTAAVPLVVREAGRRMNSLKQGGLPVDVAEAVAYLAAPGSGAVTGQVLRVCGQSLLGA